MTTVTAIERMEIASARLDAWLESFDKLDDPIEAALDDLGGWVEELCAVRTDECYPHGDKDCVPCTDGAATGVQKMYGRLRELWEART